MKEQNDAKSFLLVASDLILQETDDEHQAQTVQLLAEGIPSCFLTGSRIYGISREHSDIDMVVFTTKKTVEQLKGLATSHKSRYVRSGTCLYFGNLNLICETNPKKVAGWWKGTRYLESIKPVKKETACAMFDNLFEPVWAEEDAKNSVRIIQL